MQRPRTSTPEAPIDTLGPFEVITLAAPALALAVSWTIEMWRRALIARAEHLARRAVELERRLNDAHGELHQWERRATSASSALTDVSAALPWDTVTAEHRIARLAEDLREALTDNAAQHMRLMRAAALTTRHVVRARPVARERSA